MSTHAGCCVLIIKLSAFVFSQLHEEVDAEEESGRDEIEENEDAIVDAGEERERKHVSGHALRLHLRVDVVEHVRNVNVPITQGLLLLGAIFVIIGDDTLGAIECD